MAVSGICGRFPYKQDIPLETQQLWRTQTLMDLVLR